MCAGVYSAPWPAALFPRLPCVGRFAAVSLAILSGIRVPCCDCVFAKDHRRILRSHGASAASHYRTWLSKVQSHGRRPRHMVEGLIAWSKAQAYGQRLARMVGGSIAWSKTQSHGRRPNRMVNEPITWSKVRLHGRRLHCMVEGPIAWLKA